jgi:NAD-dependent SIR2 family protein deacetylase
MIEGRIEMERTETILERRAKLAHNRCVECRVYEDPERFRREDDGHIARSKRCFACEFPHCETCGRQRAMTEGPVLVREKEAQADDRREEGPWHQTKTRRPNRPSDP